MDGSVHWRSGGGMEWIGLESLLWRHAIFFDSSMFLHCITRAMAGLVELSLDVIGGGYSVPIGRGTAVLAFSLVVTPECANPPTFFMHSDRSWRKCNGSMISFVLVLQYYAIQPIARPGCTA